MGLTSHGIELIEKVLKLVDVKEVMELGSQNLFDKHYEGIKHSGQHSTQPFASDYYNSKGIKYNCIDLNGENNAFVYDLSEPIPHDKKYMLVSDFGCGEHCKSIYNVFKNIHNLLEVGGIAIRENPKTGNWIGHGCNYMTIDIYNKIIAANNYRLIDLHEHPAMSNDIDGWETCCIYQKINDAEFMSEEDFKLLNVPTQ